MKLLFFDKYATDYSDFFFLIIKMELSKLSKNISYLLHSNPVGLGGLEVYIDKKKDWLFDNCSSWMLYMEVYHSILSTFAYVWNFL